MITEPLMQIKSADKIVWMSKPSPMREKTSEITDYTVITLIDTIRKTIDRKTASEIIMTAAEALGEKLYDEFVKEQILSPKGWAECINEKIFVPMGVEVKYKKITQEGIECEVYSCPTSYRALLTPEITCPFSYGYARALWRKTFPEGEVKMGTTLSAGGKSCEFMFLTKSKENFREQMKSVMETTEITIGKTEYKMDLTEFSIKISDYVILSLTDSLFKHVEKRQASEVVINAAEELGRIIFQRRIKEKPPKWTPMEWAKRTSAYIWNSQGIGIVFSEISDEKIVSHVFKCPTPERAGKAPHITCPFSWGYARGAWKVAFPEGEVIMGGTMAHGAPTCEFIWYVKAEKEHLEERKKIERYLTKEEEVRML